MSAEVVSDKLLRDIPLFRNLNPSERRQIADVIHMQEFKPGDIVIRQGESSRNLWVVVEGRCDVVKHLDRVSFDAESVVLAVLEPFNQFGEMSFFHPAPHSADVRAQTAVKLLQIPYVDYKDMVDEQISAAYKLALNAVESLAERLRRMDDWIAELISHQPASEAQSSEWSVFREKLFNRWNL
jgi:CRP/FNR family transcriptional regulator, cyclic AMP receptor protein